MIHFIHVWETPVPTDFESAARLVESQLGRTAPLNPKYPALVAELQRLLAEHGQAEPGSESPWVGEAPVGHYKTVMLRVEVKPSAAERVGSMVVAAAGPLGLVVFDRQRGKLWLPDGRVIVPQRPMPGPTKTQTMHTLHDTLKPLLGPLGWKGRRNDPHACFGIDNPETRFEIGFGCKTYYVKVELAMVVTVIPRVPPPWNVHTRRWGDRCHLLLDELLDGAGARLPGQVLQRHVRFTVVSTDLELGAFAEACRSAIERHVLPVLQSCATLESLERLLNPAVGEPQMFASSTVGPLIAVSLGRPDVPRLIETYIQTRPEPWVKVQFPELAADIARTQREMH